MSGQNGTPCRHGSGCNSDINSAMDFGIGLSLHAGSHVRIAYAVFKFKNGSAANLTCCKASQFLGDSVMDRSPLSLVSLPTSRIGMEFSNDNRYWSLRVDRMPGESQWRRGRLPAVAKK